MDFDLPQELVDFLAELDEFIETTIKPIENRDDNIRFFDHRREWARTDFENGGLPRPEWEALLGEARAAADDAGYLRFAWPEEFGGKGGSNLWMAVIREHLAAKGLGLHCDLQTEHSIVGNNPFVVMFKEFATPEQYERDVDKLMKGQLRTGFGLTEPNHGSDATWMETRAVPQEKDGEPGWLVNGEKMWTTGAHHANYIMTFARTSGEDGDARGITCFLVPIESPGLKIEEYLWTFNMPTDHPRISFTNVWIPEDSYWGEVGGGFGDRTELRASEPHPPGSLLIGRRRLLHRGKRQVRAAAQAVRQAALRQPGHSVAIDRDAHPGRDAAALDTQDCMADRPDGSPGGGADDLGPRVDVQLLGEPALLRSGRPGHAGARRHRLLASQAVRAHLPPPPPLSHHRGLRGNPDA